MKEIIRIPSGINSDFFNGISPRASQYATPFLPSLKIGIIFYFKKVKN